MIAKLSASLVCGPKFIVPRHRRETLSADRPSFVYCMRVSCAPAYPGRPGDGPLRGGQGADQRALDARQLRRRDGVGDLQRRPVQARLLLEERHETQTREREVVRALEGGRRDALEVLEHAVAI